MTAVEELTTALRDGHPEERNGVLTRFWAGPAAVTPVVEPAPDDADHRLVTFLWRDAAAHAVLLTVNKITLGMADGQMARIEGTDVWHRTFRLRSDWRGSYAILPLDAAQYAEVEALEPRWAMRTARERGRLDPRNPRSIGTHWGRASVAELEHARPTTWPDAASAPEGETSEHRLPNGRRLWVHRPAGDDGSVARPIVFVLDGEVWHRSGDAVRTVDALHADGGIRTPYLVLIDAEGPRRMTDLSIEGTMSVEIVEVLLPWARSVLPVSTDAGDVIVSGESLGGLTALRTAFDHPDAVGGALAQSSSLWQHDMLDRATTSSPVQLYVTAGMHEERLLEANRRLVALLGGLSHDHVYVEFNGGHDMAWWRGLWGDGIRHLLTA